MSQSVASEDSEIEDSLRNQRRLPISEIEREAGVAKGLDLGSKKMAGIQTGAPHIDCPLDARTGERDEFRARRAGFLVNS